MNKEPYYKFNSDKIFIIARSNGSKCEMFLNIQSNTTPSNMDFDVENKSSPSTRTHVDLDDSSSAETTTSSSSGSSEYLNLDIFIRNDMTLDSKTNKKKRSPK